MPRHVLGGTGFQAPSDTVNVADRRLQARHGHVQPDERRPIRQHRRALRLRRERRRKRGDEEARHRGQVPEGGRLQGLPRDAREAEGHRRGARRHARSHPRRRRDGGDAARQARLRPEAADAHDQRSAGADRGRAQVQGRDADGQSGTLRRGAAPDAGVARRRRDRRGARGAVLDEPADLAAGHAAADRDDCRSRWPRLGPVDRADPDASLPQDLSSVRLAGVAGLRRRRDGRHGLPRHGRGVHDPEARFADERRHLAKPSTSCRRRPDRAASGSASPTTTAIRRRRSSTCRSPRGATCRR